MSVTTKSYQDNITNFNVSTNYDNKNSYFQTQIFKIEGELSKLIKYDPKTNRFELAYKYEEKNYEEYGIKFSSKTTKDFTSQQTNLSTNFLKEMKNYNKRLETNTEKIYSKLFKAPIRDLPNFVSEVIKFRFSSNDTNSSIIGHRRKNYSQYSKRSLFL